MNNKIENTGLSQTEKTADSKSQMNRNEGLISEFKNQLTLREIFKGTLIYVNRKLWFIMVLYMAMFVAMGISSNGIHYLRAILLLSVCAVIIVDLLLILIMMIIFLFSNNKVITYKLYDDFLEISNKEGVSHIYKYNRIRSINKKNIIILCLPLLMFAIIAKRHLSPEQMQMLTTKNTKK